MDAWFATGRIVDLLLAFTVLEGVALVAYHSLTGRGVRPRDFLANLVSGVCLMAALRSALAASHWHWTAAFLFAAGLAHGFDMLRRWQR